MKTLCILLLTLSTVLCAIESPAHLITFDDYDELSSYSKASISDGALEFTTMGLASISYGVGDIVGSPLGANSDKTFVLQFTTGYTVGDSSLVKVEAASETVVCIELEIASNDFRFTSGEGSDFENVNQADQTSISQYTFYCVVLTCDTGGRTGCFTWTQVGSATPTMGSSTSGGDAIRFQNSQSVASILFKSTGSFDGSIREFAVYEQYYTDASDIISLCTETVPVTSSPTTMAPSESPTTMAPSDSPTTMAPSDSPTTSPTLFPTVSPTVSPTLEPTTSPTKFVSMAPTESPTASPSTSPTTSPTSSPTSSPTVFDDSTSSPTESPTSSPSAAPSTSPTSAPSSSPTSSPSSSPTVSPTGSPTAAPSSSPTVESTEPPTECNVEVVTIGGAGLTWDMTDDEGDEEIASGVFGGDPVSFTLVRAEEYFVFLSSSVISSSATMNVTIDGETSVIELDAGNIGSDEIAGVTCDAIVTKIGQATGTGYTTSAAALLIASLVLLLIR